MSETVDLLAVGAHPDDMELTCGGTLARMHALGHKTGIIDLTRGEMGTRGTPETRAKESRQADEILGISVRESAGFPDARLKNDDDTRRAMVEVLRRLRPTTVILPFVQGKHPDHRVASLMCRDACFLSALKNYPAEGKVHRPHKILYALAYREDPIKPTFVVDTSDFFEIKLTAVKCYASQFDGVQSAGELFPTGQDLYDLIRTQDAHCGSLIRCAYGEPFYTEETIRVDDVVALGVSSM